MKKVIACIMVVVALMAMSMSSFAAESRYDPRIDIYLPNDWYVVLNCYTSGAVTDRTPVSTWARTGNDSQRWILKNEGTGRRSIRSMYNENLAINANRSYVGTQVDMLTASNNNFYDYTFTVFPSGTVAGRFGMDARGGHTQKVYITRNGNANICTWQYAGSTANQNWIWEDY